MYQHELIAEFSLSCNCEFVKLLQIDKSFLRNIFSQR